MAYSLEDLTLEDMDFIAASLNLTWNNAHKQLQTRSLGDLERKWLEKTKVRAKELMVKIGV